VWRNSRRRSATAPGTRDKCAQAGATTSPDYREPGIGPAIPWEPLLQWEDEEPFLETVKTVTYSCNPNRRTDFYRTPIVRLNRQLREIPAGKEKGQPGCPSQSYIALQFSAYRSCRRRYHLFARASSRCRRAASRRQSWSRSPARDVPGGPAELRDYRRERPSGPCR
jgi:hypothetical protein